jgi:branched-subunit amino acid aminotransferase/4-amino-4-deoxychorismate lyase
MCAGTADGRPLVQTASEADGVLGGIMRARVLSACRHLHFTCQERAPLLHERHTWREAFLTNRRVLFEACGTRAWANGKPDEGALHDVSG